MKEKGFAHLLLIVGFVLLTAAALIILPRIFGNNSPKENNPVGQIIQRVAGGDDPRANCQSNPSPKFTADFTDLSKIQHLAPIGGVMVGSPARSYVFVKEDVTGTPIYAPTDATLESMIYAIRRDPRNPDDKKAKGEYRLDFRVSCEVTFYFDHIDRVTDEIKNFWKGGPIENTRENQNVNFKVKAGDLLGFSDGTDMSRGFDFFLLNTSKKVPHINPARWQWEQTTIADCPYDYFVDDLKSKYYNAFASQDGQKLQNPSCGSPSHDVAGTASGGWFQGDSKDNQGKWLEIASQNGRVEVNLRESGSFGFSIRDYSPKIMPENLTVGNATCYAEQGKWAYIKLVAESQLALAKGSGTCPASFPQNLSETWER